ncbi:hypothetical protein DSO57_1035678 [Entomophthora muscae]|uniref:Uncharacterized protein n=2 Tax=Entomophthora muscae TaxID=34485 RepID=A0ACC2T1X2_9FUNG|nr:hypothetical protein DSO57_1027859 [Entomophthora muscae]KAJ9079404.1 hypothetical protein DSO57_1035678 [Entomophthora muscae]
MTRLGLIWMLCLAIVRGAAIVRENSVMPWSSASKNGTSPWPLGRHYFTSARDNFEWFNSPGKDFSTLHVTLMNPTPTNPNRMRQIKITGPRPHFSLMADTGTMVTYVVDINDEFIVEDFDGLNHQDPLYSITGPAAAFTEVTNQDGTITLRVDSHSSNLTVNFLSINMEKTDFKRVNNQPSIITYYILFFASNSSQAFLP